ncbi:MAG: class I SAM-dependent methyltransferase [Acidimicrobiales bacterium]
MSNDRSQRFGEVADLYDRARPRYPDAVIARIVETSGVDHPKVLDVGCGTGIATVQLLAAGADVVGLEPDEQMLEVARQRTGSAATFRSGRFADVAATDGEFDVVTAAQAWHWVDPESALPTAHRILATGGVLAPFWNVRAEQDDSVSLALIGLYREVMADLADAFMAPQGGRRIESEEALRESALFTEPVVERFAWRRTCTTSQYQDLMATHSVYQLLSPERRGLLLAGAADILESAGGSFTFGYETILLLSHRVSGP